MENSRITFRPIKRQEHSLALNLWGAAFGVWPNYFQRYYESDPWYQEGDTLGAWENDRLVSALHICRRSLFWKNDKSLVCGGIANVGTLEEYRNRGLSRQLLTASIQHMEQTGVAFSVLWTDLHAHYAASGWEQLQQPDLFLTLPAEGFAISAQPLSLAEPSPGIQVLYSSSPRFLQIERTSDYYTRWLSPRGQGSDKQYLFVPNRGYAVVEMRKDDRGVASATIAEFRSVDSSSERSLLLQVAQHVAADSCPVRLKALPQFNELSDLEPAKAVLGPGDPDMMIRNISLTQNEYARIRQSYISGRACFWQADHV